MNKTNFRNASRFSDSGMGAYFTGIYNYMSAALALSGITAVFAAYSGLTRYIYSSPLGVMLSFAPLGVALYLSASFSRMSYESVKNAFFGYAVLMGLSLSTIFFTFRLGDIFQAFFITSITFLGTTIYGYTTKKDLTSMGSFLFMAVWGLIVASIFNIFIKSPSFSYGISALAVLIFTGLTAYDTQKLKMLYHLKGNMSSDDHKKASIFGAMQLYMDFISIFIHMLHLMGRRKD